MADSRLKTRATADIKKNRIYITVAGNADAKALEQASCYDSILPIMVEPGGWQLPARAFERGMRHPWPFLMKSKAPGSKDSEVS